MLALVSLGFRFAPKESRGKLEFLAKPPCKASACSPGSSPLQKNPSIPCDGCWKWDRVKCDGLGVEEGDLNHTLHPLPAATVPSGRPSHHLGASFPSQVAASALVSVRGWWVCAWCLSLCHPAHAGEGMALLLFWVCISSPARAFGRPGAPGDSLAKGEYGR